MLLVCSYCRRTIRHDPSGGAGLSHGMCLPCAEHFEKLWHGMSLGEYLDGLPEPVLVVNGEGRVVAANERLAALLGRSRAELRGLRGGEALACAHSRLPEGCGKTVHCRECTIRRAVDKVAETGVAAEHVPAYLKTSEGRVELQVSVSPREGFVQVVVEEMKRAEATTADA